MFARIAGAGSIAVIVGLAYYSLRHGVEEDALSPSAAPEIPVKIVRSGVDATAAPALGGDRTQATGELRHEQQSLTRAERIARIAEVLLHIKGHVKPERDPITNGSAYILNECGLPDTASNVEELDKLLYKHNDIITTRLAELGIAAQPAYKSKLDAGEFRILADGDSEPWPGEVGAHRIIHREPNGPKQLILIWPGEFADWDVAQLDLDNSYDQIFAELEEYLVTLVQ